MELVEINLVQILLISLLSLSIIFGCYLFYTSRRSQCLIPIIKSKEKGCLNMQYQKLSRFREELCIKNKGQSKAHYYKIEECNNGKLIRKERVRKYPTIFASLDKTRGLPFVSIIVPARNEEQYIERCVRSLLNQDYPNYEIIVIDDNSTDNTLEILKDIQSCFKGPNDSTNTNKLSNCDRLKIIRLEEKPRNWSGKTWASQKGYLESKGQILLFTDADTYYCKSDTLFQTVQYLQKEGLDVLTGIPTSEELGNTWSKIAVPVWNFISILFRVGSVSEVNNPKSKIAFLMGCFFLIKRDTFKKVGTFEVVRDAIQEDKALGVLIKQQGFKMRLVKLVDMVYTIWADDLNSLWHGIGRTLAPLVIKNRPKIVVNMVIIFITCVFPFIMLPFAISFEIGQNPITNYPSLSFYFSTCLLLSNVIACVTVSVFISITEGYQRVMLMYNLWGLLVGSIFVFVACLYNIVPLLIHGGTKPIVWQGRRYLYDKKQEGFAI